MPTLCRQDPPHVNKLKSKIHRVPTVMEETILLHAEILNVTDMHKNQCATGIFNLDQRFRTSFQEGRLCMNRSRESILGRGNVYEKDQEWQKSF